MPIVQVTIPQGHSHAQKEEIRSAVKAAISEALDPKVTKFIYVSVFEAQASIGDGAPTITVDLRPGRETERKAALAEGIAKAFSTTLGIDGEDVYLLLREAEAANHYAGGEPLPEWQP